MIIATIELFPHGKAKDRSVLFSVKVYNDATGTLDYGNYQYAILRAEDVGITSIETGEIKRFPRRQRDALDLLYEVLTQYHKERGESDEDHSESARRSDD